MAPTVSLILGVHNHQPVDNWHHVIEDAYEKCYKPFLDVLEAHPKIGMSIHYTGYLLDWLANHHPEIIDQLKRLIKTGQVEMFSGGYYEPVLAIIPDDDKRGQIEKLSRRVDQLTGEKPDGLWLAERVWEPHLVRPIAQAGIKYMFLDDSHFMATGLDAQELYGRYTTEEQSHMVDIFPVDQQLRYLIPYGRPQEIVDYLRTIASEDGTRVGVYFDDGEKFGVWSGTYKHVFREKWLDKFFTTLENNADWIHTITPRQYVAKARPLGRLYLPTASYGEMMEWSMPAKHINNFERATKEIQPEYKRFLRGGFWRNFLVKYPEANNIHKKMMYVSEKVRNAVNVKGETACEQALDDLWQGQSNDIFWHGVFGGLYLTNLRSANYQHLLKAENAVDAMMKGTQFLDVVERDLDCDGAPEVLVETPLQNLYFDPAEGGSLFELDYRERNFNLIDTLARRYEAYHDKLSQAVHEDDQQDSASSIHDRVVTKQKNLDQHLHYDWHRRVSFLDHFLGPETTVDGLSQAAYGEQGDFVNQPYRHTLQKDGVTLERTGQVWDGDVARRVHVEKRFAVAADKAETIVNYTITNLSDETASLWFAPEFNVNLLAGDAPDRYYYLPGVADKNGGGETHAHEGVALAEPATTLRSKKLVSRGTVREAYSIGVRDEWTKIDYALTFDRAADVWRFPIETVSQSEAGFEKVYQSSVMVPNWKLKLAPQESWQVTIRQTISTPQ